MSLYSQYVQERTDRQILETEYGFCTYVIQPNQIVYIEDVYVIPEHRDSGLASKFAKDIIEIAKNQGCNKMLASVVPTAKNSTESVKRLIGFGMKLDSSTNNFIIFSKDLV